MMALDLGGLVLVAIYQCPHCPRKFRRRVNLADALREPPRGFAQHNRACREKLDDALRPRARGRK